MHGICIKKMKDKKGSPGMVWFSIEVTKLSMEYSSEGLRLAQKPSSLTKRNKMISVSQVCVALACSANYQMHHMLTVQESEFLKSGTFTCIVRIEGSYAHHCLTNRMVAWQRKNWELEEGLWGLDRVVCVV